MISFGTMINSARLEMAREPMVWWSLAAAFIFMFLLVLAANLFADAVRDAFDPRVSVRTAVGAPTRARQLPCNRLSKVPGNERRVAPGSGESEYRARTQRPGQCAPWMGCRSRSRAARPSRS